MIKKIVKNTLVLVISAIITRLMGAVFAIFIIRYLGDINFGKYSYVLALSGILILITDFGLNTLVIREIARNKERLKQYINNIITLKILLSMPYFLVLILLFFFTEQRDTRILLIIIGVYTIILSFDEFFKSVFRAYEKMEYEALTRTIEKVLWVVLVLVAINYNLGLIGIALAITLSILIGFLISSFIVIKKFTKFSLVFDPKFLIYLLKESWPFLLTSIFVLIYFKIDTVMLSFMKNDAVVGWYNAAYKIIDALIIIPSIFMTAMYPVFSRYKNKEKLKKIYLQSFRYLLLLALPITIGIFLLADKIILFLFTYNFFNSIAALKILIFASFLSFINYPIITILNSINKQKMGTLFTGIAALINIILNVLLIPTLSYVGAAFATVISELTFFVLSSLYLSKNGFSLPKNILFKPLIITLLISFLIYYFRFMNLFLLITIIATIYFVLVYLIEFTDYDKKLIKKIIKNER